MYLAQNIFLWKKKKLLRRDRFQPWRSSEQKVGTLLVCCHTYRVLPTVQLHPQPMIRWEENETNVQSAAAIEPRHAIEVRHSSTHKVQPPTNQQADRRTLKSKKLFPHIYYLFELIPTTKRFCATISWLNASNATGYWMRWWTRILGYLRRCIFRKESFCVLESLY